MLQRFDWIPESYNYSSNLPTDMPDTLKRAVQESRKVYLSHY